MNWEFGFAFFLINRSPVRVNFHNENNPNRAKLNKKRRSKEQRFCIVN